MECVKFERTTLGDIQQTHKGPIRFFVWPKGWPPSKRPVVFAGGGPAQNIGTAVTVPPKAEIPPGAKPVPPKRVVGGKSIFKLEEIPPSALRCDTKKLFESLRRKVEGGKRAKIEAKPKLPPSPFVRGMEARGMFGGRTLLDRAVKAGWLAPIRQGKRMTLYRRKDVLAALQRIEWGELG